MGTGVVLPSGTVAFLFTDVEGSTRRWVDDAAGMRAALGLHDAVMREQIAAHGGYVFSTAGDSFAAAFSSVPRALECAAAAQQALVAASWPGTPIVVRMGVHVGEADERDGDYFGSEVSRAARVMGVAHGGQVLVTDAARLLAGGVPLVALGPTLLKDFPEPVGLHQLVVQGCRNEFPPLQTQTAVGNLRPIASALVGREQELASCARLLQESRVVTITGVGGVGKTRLAHRLAEDAALVDDGAWMVELAAAFDRESVLTAAISQLRVGAPAGRAPLDVVVDALRPRRLLLVLDNCEQVLDEAAELVEEIVARCEQVRVLVTSREGLGVAGERVFPLRSIRDHDAYRLFVDRATALRGDFAADEVATGKIVELCRRLDGIPLAIELAAARTTTMTVDEISGHLDERFRLLTGSRRRGVERHQTLRAAVGWSYDLLEPGVRAVFDCLGVFVADFELSDAEAVCAGAGVARFEVLDAVAALVDKSLLVADTTGTVGRYRLLETLRQFAVDRLGEQGLVDAVRLAHLDHYTRRFEQVRACSGGPREHTVLPMSAGFVANLNSAMTTAVDTSPEHAVRIARSLGGILPIVPHALSDAWLRSALELATDPAARNEIEANLAFADSQTGRHAQAAERAERVLAGDGLTAMARVTALYAMALSGGVYIGEFETGMRYRNEIVALAHDPEVEADTSLQHLVMAGRVLSGAVMGDFDADALAEAESRGSDLTSCFAAYSMGFALTWTDPERARVLLRDAVERAERVQWQLVIGMACRQLGSLEAHAGSIEDAVDIMSGNLERFTQTGEWLHQWINIQQFAFLLQRTDRLEAAVTLLAASATSGRARKFFPTEQPFYDALRADAVTRLGTERVEELTRLGAALTDLDALAMARRQLDELAAVVSAGPPRYSSTSATASSATRSTS